MFIAINGLDMDSQTKNLIFSDLLSVNPVTAILIVIPETLRLIKRLVDHSCLRHGFHTCIETFPTTKVIKNTKILLHTPSLWLIDLDRFDSLLNRSYSYASSKIILDFVGTRIIIKFINEAVI